MRLLRDAGIAMRFHLLGLAFLAGVAAPAGLSAQQSRAGSLDQRVTRVEQELRAVQRRVFPGGNAQFVEPEISPQPGAAPGGNASGDALANLSARVDAIEAQLRTLTGQIEEAGHRSTALEDQVSRLRAELSGRIERLEAPVRAAPAEPPPAAAEPGRPRPRPAEPAPDAAPPPAPANTSPADAEGAYNAGFRLWSQRQYAEAEAALEAAATRFPNTRWTSWMRNLQGRAYLDDNKPATAARILLANYQDNPRGERAPDSLYYLGQALTRLNRRTEACRVYDELANVYANLRDEIRRRLPQARNDAHCAT
jgi:TolA-binding protein